MFKCLPFNLQFSMKTSIKISDLFVTLVLTASSIQCAVSNQIRNAYTNTNKISPDRMKFELARLIEIENARMPQERPTVDTLYKSILNDGEMVDLVKLDIFVRGLSGGIPGDPCNPSKHEILNRAPLTIKIGEPNPSQIKAWQRSLLQNSEPLCNYYNFLQCDLNTQTCACKEDLTLQNGLCVLPLGANCGPDRTHTSFYFDALKNVKYLVPEPSPRCTLNTSCQARPLFFRRKCWCDPKSLSNCDDGPIFPKPKELYHASLRRRVDGLFELEFGEDCDPELQREMFDPPEYDLADTKTRIGKLSSILSYPLLRLCNASNHLNCSELTRKCDCWDGLSFDSKSGACRGTRGASCGRNSLQKSFYPAGPRMWHLEKVFTRSFSTRCISGAACSDSSGTCACIKTFGNKCLFPGSVFTGVLHKPIRWGSTLCVADIYNVFDQANKHMLRLEKLMVLSRNEPCQALAGEGGAVERIIDFWEQLWKDFDSEPIQCKEILLKLKEVSEEAESLAESGGNKCDRTRGLCCSQRYQECVCRKGSTWQEGRCRLLAGQACDKDRSDQIPWYTPCVRFADCVPLNRDNNNEIQATCKCQSGDSGSICSEAFVTPGPTYDSRQPGKSSTEDPVIDFLVEIPGTGSKIHKNNSASNATQEPGQGPRHNGSLTDTGSELPKLNSTEGSGSGNVAPAAIQGSNSTYNIPGNHSGPGPAYKPNSTKTPVPGGMEQDDTDMHEIHELLVEIALDRIVSKACIHGEGQAFGEIVNLVSGSNKDHVSLANASATLAALRSLSGRGTHFCDIQKFLECSSFSEECICQTGLLMRDGECRIGSGERCNVSTLEQGDLKKVFILPEPRCIDGYVCSRLPNTTKAVQPKTCVRIQATPKLNFTRLSSGSESRLTAPGTLTWITCLIIRFR